MVTQIVIVFVIAAVAVIMYIIGYSIATRNKKSAITTLIDEYDSDVKSLRAESNLLNQKLNIASQEQSKIYEAYSVIRKNYEECRQYIDKLISYDTALTQSYNKLRNDFAVVNSDRNSLLKKLKSSGALPSPSSQEYHKTKQELSTIQSTLLEKHSENVILRKTHSTLTEEKKRILEKLKKVYNAYKNVSTKATILQHKARQTDTALFEKDKLSMMYNETLEKLKQKEKQTEQLETLENEKTDLSLKIEVLKAQVDEIESIRQENKILFEQNRKIESLQKNLSMLESENAVLRAKCLVVEKPQN